MIDAVKIPVTENNSESQDLETRFNLKTFDELKYFALEICDMVDEGQKIDLGKAARNAKYLAEIDRRFDKVKAGHYVEHELIEVEDE